MLRISPGGFPLFKSYSMFSSLPSLSLSLSLCSKAYHQAAIQCFHHCLPFTFYSGDDAVHPEISPFKQVLSLFTFNFYSNSYFHYSLSFFLLSLFNAIGIMLEAIFEKVLHLGGIFCFTQQPFKPNVMGVWGYNCETISTISILKILVSSKYFYHSN